MSKLLVAAIILIAFNSCLFAVDWENYKNTYIQQDGRVIDRQNHDITHTEAVGYALFFSVCMNDPSTYDRIERWLENNLPAAKNGLYPWKWGNAGDGNWKILDSNNATDGDLWIAFARLKAAKQFNRPDQEEKANRQIRAIEHELVIEQNGKLFLLPGVYGFRDTGRITVNPSYYIPFIFETFAETTSDPVWNRLIQEGKDLLAYRFSHYRLHPDWIVYSENRFMLPDQSPLFSYDAVRIPLFWSIWYRMHPDPFILQHLEGYKELLSLPYTPLWVNLQNDSMSIHADGSGAMEHSFRYLSIITEFPISDHLKGHDEKSSTYFGDSLALFGTLPLTCYRR